MIASRLIGIGSFVPPKIVKNSDLESLMDTTHEWIHQRTGIEQRHWVDSKEESTSELAFKASLNAIEDAKIQSNEIDMIVFATSMPDHDIPGSAVFLQTKLGLNGIPCFEVRQACSGFIYALSLADSMIKSEQATCVLVVGAEVQSKALDKTPNGRGVSVIFADGAGAVIMKKTEVKDRNTGPQFLGACLHADGQYAKELWIPGPGSANGLERLSPADLEEGRQYLQMNGKYVFTHAVTKMPAVLNEVCDKTGISLDKIDQFFFHQANLRINEKVANDMGIPTEKVHNTIHKFGNTTAATIPLGMDDAKKCGKLKEGQTIAMAAFGAGFTWASAIIRL